MAAVCPVCGMGPVACQQLRARDNRADALHTFQEMVTRVLERDGLTQKHMLLREALRSQPERKVDQ